MKVARFIALGFGSGASPVAPGTAGSLVGLLIGAALLGTSKPLLAAGAAVASFVGLWAIRAATGLPLRATSEAASHADPGWVVIDEIAGQMLAMLPLHRLTWPGLAAAFALFRLFDIAKPGPIGWADRQGGAAGIMADDVLAGLAAMLVLLLAQTFLGVPP